jgi:hypothetical protein
MQANIQGAQAQSSDLSASGHVDVRTHRPSALARSIGWVLSTLAILFLLFDGAAKVMKVAPVLEASARLEVPERVIPVLGMILIAGTLIYQFHKLPSSGQLSSQAT